MFKGKVPDSINMFRRRKSQPQNKEELQITEKGSSQPQPSSSSSSQSYLEPSQPHHRRNSKESAKSKTSSISTQNSTFSTSHKDNTSDPSRRFDVEILHKGDKKEPSEGQQTTTCTHETNNTDDCLSPLTSNPDGQESGDNHSIALSETDTLCASRKQRLELQDIYTDNFSMYLPFVLRQLRLADDREQAEVRRRREARASADHDDHTMDHFDEDYDAENDTVADDDLSTIFNDSQSPNEQHHFDHYRVMDRRLSAYNYKRSVVFVGSMLKNDILVFPSAASFKLFKQLRGNIKKERKSSTIVYDANGSIKKVTPSNGYKSDLTRPNIDASSGDVIDERSHIIPISYKIKGQGLPLLKMHSPTLSTFRKNTPYLIFKKYKEVPSPPPNLGIPGESRSNEVDFETFDYCFVHSKFSQNYRRFIFEFYPNSSATFKVVLFQSSFKPFADFIYKNTRFRVIGTTIPTGLVCEYNPHMRLLVIDDDEPSLCDGITNKQSSSKFLKLKKSSADTSSSKEGSTKFDANDASTYINPIPNKKFLDEDGFSNSCHHRATFIPNNLPPFGCFKDANMYKKDDSGFIPKRYFESGKAEIYQDVQSQPPTMSTATPRSSRSTTTTADSFFNSTLSVDDDTLVLSTIFCTLREVNVKNANMTNSTPMMRGAASMTRSPNFGLMSVGLSTL
ncbi:hypothetical protein I9W82_003005 [Candida metapsilosis]|uniref:Uncharacterized protein n=1 Tax=Candida metapsilosis TaxID=273372 RepID=A0A8H7ZHM8_9ASCO|nr:hypothetical protein I9W82_003005 [Candida metapsilosis]